MTDMNNLPDLTAAPLWRRIAAAVYDYLLVIAIWFVTAGIIISIFNHFFHSALINDNGVGKPPEWFLHWVLSFICLLEAWCFYAWFWLHGGQTLGMRAWRIKVTDYRNRKLALWQTLVRFAGAWLSACLAGTGYLLVWLPPHQTLHDRLSATETRVVPVGSESISANRR